MKELVEEIRGEITKCELSRRKEKTTELQKHQLDAMIHAYNIVLFHIEINYKRFFEYEIKSALESGFYACCKKNISQNATELYFKKFIK
jgi:hypothetical protein